MAESVLVSALVQAILEKTTSLLVSEVRGLAGGVRKELTKLEKRLRDAQSLIEEAEEKQLEDRSIRLWLSELKDAAYEAEDIVDEFHRELLRRKPPDTQPKMKTTVRHLFSSQNPLRFHVTMGRRISEVVERFDAIAAQRINSGRTEIEFQSGASVGTIEDLKNMLLSQGESDDCIKVLPIEVGGRVFEAIAETILESVKGNQALKGNQFGAGLSMESLQQSLGQMFSSKRCLLILDDMWNEDVTKWEQLKLMLSLGARGRALIADNPSSDEQDKYSIETSNFLVYSFAEITLATNGFSESAKIGKGGYGNVYKGKLQGTIVAIKKLDSHSNQSKQEFFNELDVLCQMRHQNLVNLIGACFECYALVYEFLPNGSLEDCFRNCSSRLTWKIRTCIIFDICSSLKFLHSRSVVHGDIKPHNILLDAGFNGKLADFGFCRFLPKGTASVAFLETLPKGSPEYIDLKFLETGILTASSDLYSFGVTILKLVTGRQPLGLSRKVSDADENTFREMIDATAGSWPFELAQEMAGWGLECCYNNEKSSQLMDEMWKHLEEMLAKINCTAMTAMSVCVMPSTNSSCE